MVSKMRVYVIIFCLLILFLPALAGLGVRLVPNKFQPSLDWTQKIYGDVAVSQPLISTSDRLSGVGVSIKNPNLINQEDIIMSLYRGNDLMRVVTINGKSIGDGNFVKFLFEPLPGSKGQIYQVVFSAPSSPIEKALEIFVTKDPSWEKMIVRNKDSSVGLSMVVFYRPSGPISLLTDIYKEWFKKFASDSSFFIFYGTIFALGLGYLLIGVRQDDKVS